MSQVTFLSVQQREVTPSVPDESISSNRYLSILSALGLKAEATSNLQSYCFEQISILIEAEKWDELDSIKDAVLDLKDEGGRSLLVKYIQERNALLVQQIFSRQLAVLLCNGDIESVLYAAIDNSEMLSQLRENECFSFVDRKGRNCLQLAAKRGHYQLLEPLLKVIPSNTRYRKKQGYLVSALAVAILKGKTTCVDILIQADPNYCIQMRVRNMSALHLAQVRPEILEHLLAKHFKHMRFLLEAEDGKGRTPLLYAAAKGNQCAAAILCRHGAHTRAVDFKGKDAFQLAACQESFSIENLEKIACVSIEEKPLISIENELSYPPKGIAYQGGGARVLCYLGPIDLLDLLGIEAEKFGGTSGGACTAAFQAIGLGYQEIIELLTDFPFYEFLDHELSQKALAQSSPLLKVLDEFMTFYKNSLNGFAVLNGNAVIFAGVVAATVATDYLVPNQVTRYLLRGSTGLSSGDKLFNWLNRLFEQQTTIPNLTFGELKDAIKEKRTSPQGRLFKHLHVFSTKILSGLCEIVQFSSEDETWDSLLVASAVTASAAYPFAFEVQFLKFKNFNTGEIYTDTKSSYIDGGAICNFPIKFDDHESRNPTILGFSLYSPKEEKKKEESPLRPATTITDILKALQNVFRHGEKLLANLEYNRAPDRRIIRISTEGIGTLEFGVDPYEGKGVQAIQRAREDTLQALLEKFPGKIPHPDSLKRAPPLLVDEPLTEITLTQSKNPIHSKLQKLEELVDQMKYDEAEKFYQQEEEFFAAAEFMEESLFYLLENEKTLLIRFLHEKGISFNYLLKIKKNSQEYSMPIAHFTIVTNRIRLFKLFSRITNYITAGEAGYSALHFVAVSNSMSIYSYLRHSNRLSPLLGHINEHGGNALLLAILGQHFSLFMTLLNHPEEALTVQDYNGITIICTLVIMGNLECFDAFIAKARERECITHILEIENGREDSILFFRDNREILRRLIRLADDGLDLTKLQKQTNKSLLYILAKSNETKLVKKYCSKIKKHHPDQYHQIINQEAHSSVGKLKTPLMIAAEKGRCQTVKFLIQEGADFQKAVGGITPLKCASRRAGTIIRQAIDDKLKSAVSNEAQEDSSTLPQPKEKKTSTSLLQEERVSTIGDENFLSSTASQD